MLPLIRSQAEGVDRATLIEAQGIGARSGGIEEAMGEGQPDAGRNSGCIANDQLIVRWVARCGHMRIPQQR